MAIYYLTIDVQNKFTRSIKKYFIQINQFDSKPFNRIVVLSLLFVHHNTYK